MNFRPFLRKIRVIEENPNGYKRINPFNPLSYIVILLTIVFGVLLFGPLGFYNEWKETNMYNPFKWQ